MTGQILGNHEYLACCASRCACTSKVSARDKSCRIGWKPMFRMYSAYNPAADTSAFMRQFGHTTPFLPQCDQAESVRKKPEHDGKDTDENIDLQFCRETGRRLRRAAIHLAGNGDNGGNSICASRKRSRIALFSSPCVAPNRATGDQGSMAIVTVE